MGRRKLTLVGAELGQRVGWDGGGGRPILGGGADLRQGLVPLLHRTHLLHGLRPAAHKGARAPGISLSAR